MKDIENGVLRNELSKIQKYSDQYLLAETEILATRERETTFLVLQHLREIERRKLFADLGFKSLWDYCCNKLKYSEDEAWRRISAMRLLRDAPEAEAMIESGQISLTVLNLAGRYFREADALGLEKGETNAGEATEVAPSQISRAGTSKNDTSSPDAGETLGRLNLLRELQNKSKKQAEEVLADKLFAIECSSGREGRNQKANPRRETTRSLGKDRFELKMTVDRKFLAKLEKLRGLLAHRKISAGSQNHAVDIFDWLMDQSIEKLDKGRQTPVGMSAKSPALEQGKKTQAKELSPVDVVLTAEGGEKSPALEQVSRRSLSGPAVGSTNSPALEQVNRANNRKRKYISVKITREIWRRANSKCENCGSSWALQLEHVKPKALGGSDVPENLKLLCRNCNLRAAVRIFGCESLEGHLEKVRRER